MKIAEAVKGRERPALIQLLKLLESLPKDEVFTTKEIQRMMAGRGSIHNFHGERLLEPYTAPHAGNKYWGSKPAIQAFRAVLTKVQR